MADRPQPPRSDAVADEALAWFARMNDAGAGERDREAFRRWLAQSPAHRAAYAEVEDLWSRLDAPSAAVGAEQRDALAPLLAAIDARSRAAGARSGASGRRRSRVLAPLAACLLLAVVIAGVLFPDALQGLRADHATGKGERREVELADGSTVHLGADTAIAVRYGPEARRIELLRGEAFFDVSRDPRRPFVVAARGGAATAVGTAFHVGLLPEQVSIAVAEGAVAVAHSGSSSAGVRVGAGQGVSYGAAGLGAVGPADLEDRLAWRQGRLVFYREPLGDVIAEVNRYRSGRIVIADPGLRDLVVTGVFQTANPERILAAIESTLGLRALSLAGYLTVLY